MSDNLPNWPHGHRNHMDDVTGEQGIVSDYSHLRRAPTRAELFHPYIPADILEDRLQPMDPHIQAAIDRLIRDAENDAIAMANDEHGREGYESEDESEEMDIDPEDEEIEPSANVHNAERAAFHDAEAVNDKGHVNYCTSSHQYYANVPQPGKSNPNFNAHADVKGETSGMSLSNQHSGDARELTQTYHQLRSLPPQTFLPPTQPFHPFPNRNPSRLPT
jgi:hypothetical protein